MIEYILIFLLFSFVGWIIDTIYSSIFVHKKFIPSGYYRNIPLCPIYGIGGVIILQIFSKLINYEPMIVILITTIFIIILEYLGGVFCIKFLKERLWDYSKRKFNLHGHIDLLNSSFWLILITILYFIIVPNFDSIEIFLHYINEKTENYEIYITAIFMITILGLTIKTKDRRLQKRKKLAETNLQHTP